MLNGRNFESLLTVIPGVSSVNGANGTYQAGQGAITSAVVINGSSDEESMYTIDGVYNDVSASDITLPITPVVDHIAEMRVLSDNFSAKYGLAGRQVLVTTKSGGEAVPRQQLFLRPHQRIRHGTRLSPERIGAVDLTAPVRLGYHARRTGGDSQTLQQSGQEAVLLRRRGLESGSSVLLFGRSRCVFAGQPRRRPQYGGRVYRRSQREPDAVCIARCAASGDPRRPRRRRRRLRSGLHLPEKAAPGPTTRYCPSAWTPIPWP